MKKLRMGELEASWEEMGADGASVRTDDVAQLGAYLSKYSEIRDAWWALALRRVESRANLKRYAGKRKVLDGFFAKTRNAIQGLFKDANIHLAYGSAGLKMKPTGKGEVAVVAASQPRDDPKGHPTRRRGGRRAAAAKGRHVQGGAARLQGQAFCHQRRPVYDGRVGERQEEGDRVPDRGA